MVRVTNSPWAHRPLISDSVALRAFSLFSMLAAFFLYSPLLATNMHKSRHCKLSSDSQRWKDEVDTTLVFVLCAGSTNHDHLRNYLLMHFSQAGLFSAVGAVFLVERYKWLYPDSGDETVQLLNVTAQLNT